MDIHRIIRDLNEERKHLERIIESLELVAKTGGGPIKPPGRRGRKFMDIAGREEVSIRMKKYWAGRREAKEKLAAEAVAETAKPVTEAEQGRPLATELIDNGGFCGGDTAPAGPAYAN
jgi:hypothetical protein